MREHRIQREGFELKVRDQGDGPAVIFGHSLGFDWEMWSFVAPMLSSEYRMIALDLRGHGDSTGPSRDYPISDMADDVVAVMDQLALDQAAYCGLSMGGMVGMHLALKYPERINGLVLMSTSATEEPESNRTTYDMLNEQTRGTPPNPAVVQFLLGLMFSGEFRSRCPDVVKHFENKLQRVNDDPSYFSVRSVIHRDGFEEEISKIDLPTLVICAEADTSFPVSELELIHEKIQGSQFIRLPGAGHMSAVENPDSVAEMIQSFLMPLMGCSTKPMEELRS